MKSLAKVLLAVSVVFSAHAFAFPTCQIELADSQGTTNVKIEMNLITYPQSDLAVYAYHGTFGKFRLDVSQCDGTYLAYITGPGNVTSQLETAADLATKLEINDESLAVNCQ